MNCKEQKGMERRKNMTRFLKFAAIGLLALAIFVPAASARPGIIVGGYWGPGFYGPAYGWYGPGWYGPGYYGAYGAVPNTGKIKFDTKMKDSGIYVDGGYAGTVKQLGSFSLRPGDHDIELRSPSGQTIFEQKVNVVVGKTIKLAA